jgi:N-acetylneuraminate epimerase
MMKKCLVLAAFVSALASAATAEITTTPTQLQWSEFTPLPDPKGRGGMFAGISGDALLVVGGTNFPGAPLWENGAKSWYDDISVLPAGAAEWKTGFTFPGSARAYGVSATVGDSVICAGGADASRHYAEVVSLTWDGNTITSKTLPALPRPIAYGGGAVIGKTIYVVGGITETSSTTALADLYALNLDDLSRGWQTLAPLPGPSRILPAVTALDGSLYVVAGSHLSPGADGKIQRQYLKDAWKYTPGTGWHKLADAPRGAVGAPAMAMQGAGQSCILISGGDDGTYAGFEPVKDYPGFTAQVLQYDVQNNTWSDAGRTPLPTVTPAAVRWKGGSLLIGGEIAPGVRTPKILFCSGSQR